MKQTASVTSEQAINKSVSTQGLRMGGLHMRELIKFRLGVKMWSQ